MIYINSFKKENYHNFNDVLRMHNIFLIYNGLDVSLSDCENIWVKYSKLKEKEWIDLPKEDDKLSSLLREAIFNSFTSQRLKSTIQNMSDENHDLIKETFYSLQQYDKIYFFQLIKDICDNITFNKKSIPSFHKLLEILSQVEYQDELKFIYDEMNEYEKYYGSYDKSYDYALCENIIVLCSCWVTEESLNYLTNMKSYSNYLDVYRLEVINELKTQLKK